MDIYSYLQQLHHFISYQEQRIQALEKKIQLLETETENLKTRPAINIDTIEYKFDQLKVETLEGTLNIGLNPSDLENIEDFAVGNNQIHTPPFSPENLMQRTIKIEDAIREFLESNLPKIVAEAEQKLDITADPSCVDFIRDDILRQLPNRISHHLKQIPHTSRNDQEQDALIENIINQLKQEIQNGVHTFMQNLPENMKGLKNE